MKPKSVEVPSIREPVMASPGFEKKRLSDYKLDLLALCQFGCSYCSSNDGNYLRINRQPFADLTEQQLGFRVLPTQDPALMFVWADVLEKLRAQLSRKHRSWGTGQTLVFSMLTDGFSPELVRQGVTEEALRLVLARTDFRIRVLTKNSVVGSPRWLRFFTAYRDRFVVGLSTGTSDGEWARRVEVGTPSPTARLRALQALQQAGVATYGMLCPVFPDLLAGNALEQLIDQIRPDTVEHVWAEPYNDRRNWRSVRDGYERGSPGHVWLTDVYERRRTELWSSYATELYVRLRRKAQAEGWLHKLRYLLYEDLIGEADASEFAGLDGVLLQSTTGDDGRTRNPFLHLHDSR